VNSFIPMTWQQRVKSYKHMCGHLCHFQPNDVR
jgi:hypothetical protein